MAARPADPFLRALHDLTPEGVSGPPPAWVRDLVTTEEFRYARDAAERTPVGVTIRWLAALLTPAGSALLADFEEGDGIQRIVAVLAGLRPADDPQVEAMVDGLVYATLVTARGSRAQRDAIEALAWLVGDRAAAREILLAAHEADRLDPEATDLYEEVLGRSGADDPRVRAVLLERLAVEPELGAPLMAWHGDVRFVPPISEERDPAETSESEPTESFRHSIRSCPTREFPGILEWAFDLRGEGGKSVAIMRSLPAQFGRRVR